MWQVSAVMLVVLGVVEKFATAFTLIPDPVLGAMVRHSRTADLLSFQIDLRSFVWERVRLCTVLPLADVLVSRDRGQLCL